MLHRRFPFAASCFAVLTVAFGAPIAAQEGASPAGQEETASVAGQEQTLYALGYLLSDQLASLGLSEEELQHVQRGIADHALGRDSQVDLNAVQGDVQAFARGRVEQQAAAETAASAEFVAAEAARPGAVTTDSGLVYTEITAGEGAQPGAPDTVTVHYHGTLRDGSVFDSSVERDTPASFRLDQVIPCWTEGVQKMRVGGKSRLVCPAEIAYGAQGRPPVIAGGAALAFDVELLSVTPATEAAAQP